jgi:hypothetical protein
MTRARDSAIVEKEEAQNREADVRELKRLVS